MLLQSIVVLAISFVNVIAVPARQPAGSVIPAGHVLHERRDVEHPAFSKRSPVPVGRQLPVRVGLTQRNLDFGHDLLMEISTPGSPKYGQHHSADEVIDLFAPSEETVRSVSKWLEDAGISHFSQSFNKQWMQFDTEVEVLEALVKAKFHEYEHVESGATHVACDEYHVPAHIQEHIDYITPGIKLVSTKGASSQKNALKKRTDFAFPRIKAPASTQAMALAASGDL